MKVGVQAIIQKINEDAQRHGDELCERIKNETDADIAGANKVYSDDFSKRREMLKNHNEHEYARLLERLGSRLNREVLTYRHSLINEVFDMAAQKLRDASKEEFTAMVKSVIRGLKGSYILYVGEYSEGKLDAAEIEKIAKRRRTLDIVLSGEAVPHKSGFLLSDSRIEYNCLFEDLIEDQKAKQAASVMKEIFNDIEIKE